MEEKRRHTREGVNGVRRPLFVHLTCGEVGGKKKNFSSWFRCCESFFRLLFRRSCFLPPSATSSSSLLLKPPFHSTAAAATNAATIFLSVYLSTFTVTALESQESEATSSLSLPPLRAAPRLHHPFHLSPSHWLRFISLCATGGMDCPPSLPLRPADSVSTVVTHSLPPGPSSCTFTQLAPR